MKITLKIRQIVKIWMAVLLCNMMGCLHFHEGPLPNEPEKAQFMEIDGIRLRYDVRGTGPVVVLLHGFASSLDVWGRLVQDLESDYTIVRLDLKGFGWSERPEGDYSPQAQADLVWGMLEKLQIDKFALVGHSWGSSVALQMALNQPTRIERLALYDAWVYEEQLPAFFIWSRTPGFGETMFRLWYKERPEDRMAMAFHNPEIYIQESFSESVDEGLDRPGTVRAALEAVRGQDYEAVQHRYKEISMPVLLLWGDSDQVAPLWVGQRLAAELPYARLKVYGACGHFPMIESYGSSTYDLVDFLSESGL